MRQYNLLNEPTDSEGHRLTCWYDQAEKAVRAIDSKHILFLDGVRPPLAPGLLPIVALIPLPPRLQNTFAADFTCFTRPYPNTVYGYHDCLSLFPASAPRPAADCPSPVNPRL